ncbi:solute carrier family 13 (sodium-dependent dicarboxylate transporter), member 2/3/5 [Tindallia magadiensis]|uniref:Solute carrier family 13 (Sodium-dependent dicarboxylate transporter), member 2/3/5 n=1 Tax=Tindallia magadiensis TaxID=69895 RepID=A0A1I3HCI2_9FIRM|nr:DASS family sodium-coupled anion symporter [Tindallia magadiensis]SFI33445.1 solute carrier family 13 (sodium-dependent dicarboxylate transporter), member 2/3/5 [Tindallia magadiensis]
MGSESKKLIYCILSLLIVLSGQWITPPEGLPQEGLTMLLIALAAAFLWMTEAVAIGVTGLVIILFQSLFGILPVGEALAYIASPVNAVVLVGYLLAGSLVNSGMDQRLSLTIISKMGEKTSYLMLGMMIATAFLSMWMSNTATVAIMVPIGTGILKMAGCQPLKSNYGKALFIGVAFSANIGGMGTPTGTPANPIAIALLSHLAGIELSFLDWTARALPMVLLLLPISWMLLRKVYPPEIDRVEGGLEAVEAQLVQMGAISREEKRVLFLFGTAITLWLSDSFLSFLPEGWLYMVAVFLTIWIVMPKIGYLHWQEAQQRIGWDVLFLVGGGLSMGAGLQTTGAIYWIAALLENSFGTMPQALAVLTMSAITALGITIFCSLSGTATTFVPIAIGLALTFGWDPVLFAMTAGISSSFAYLLPANAAPNAVSYGAGYFHTLDMVKAGVLMMLVSVVVMGLVGAFLLPHLF